MLPPARGVTLDTTLLASGPPGEETSAQIHYLIHSVGTRVCVCVWKNRCRAMKTKGWSWEIREHIKETTAELG